DLQGPFAVPRSEVERPPVSQVTHSLCWARPTEPVDRELHPADDATTVDHVEARGCGSRSPPPIHTQACRAGRPGGWRAFPQLGLCEVRQWERLELFTQMLQVHRVVRGHLHQCLGPWLLEQLALLRFVE